jgi:hypothetical protein
VQQRPAITQETRLDMSNNIDDDSKGNVKL